MAKLDTFSSLMDFISLKKGSHNKKIGLIVDGPNMLRKEFNLNLKLVRDIVSQYGNIRVAKVLLNQYASDKLIEAIVNQGFSPSVVVGDTDVFMAIESMELIYNDHIDIIALMTRDADFLPIINKAKELGKETMVLGIEPGFGIALQNAADVSITLSSVDKSFTVEENQEPIEEN